MGGGAREREREREKLSVSKVTFPGSAFQTLLFAPFLPPSFCLLDVVVIVSTTSRPRGSTLPLDFTTCARLGFILILKDWFAFVVPPTFPSPSPLYTRIHAHTSLLLDPTLDRVFLFHLRETILFFSTTWTNSIL